MIASSFRPTLFLLLCALSTSLFNSHSFAQTWKAGVAKRDVTPTEKMWMAGYGNRNKPVEGTLHSLWIKALAIEDADNNRAVIVSTDLLGIPRTIYDSSCEALERELGLSRSQIMLHSSHTHCGPVLRGALFDVYPLDDNQKKLIEDYSQQLEQHLVDMVKEAFANLAEANLTAQQGVARFAVNRRENREPEVPKLRKEGLLKGPIDHAVPVLSVRNTEGDLVAVVFGYACHNTTLSFYQWCGDYAGFAQMELEKRYPGAQAMFFSGCGADQNPIPRRTVELCQQYGTRLADAVDSVLKQKAEPLPAMLETAYERVSLNLGPVPDKAGLEVKASARPSYSQRWAARLLQEMKDGKSFIRTYPYPVQVWRIGGKQWWITLGGEVVVDYTVKFKSLFGDDIWVAGYCNDVMAYIPSLRVLKEGGYEGASSMMVYGMPADRWAEDVEEIITKTVRGLVQQVKSDD